VTSAAFSYFTDYFLYDYAKLSNTIITIQFATFLLSSIIMSALFTQYLTGRLKKLGVLNRFLIMKSSDV
jgi:ABC-type thiamin/hydroxymethylpyrimidine transport system permease subunit